MNSKTQKVVTEAMSLLSQPRDILHDLSRHDLVWSNCEKIVEYEKLGEKINPDLLMISVYWHDVVINSSNVVSTDNVKDVVSHLEHRMPKLGFNYDEIHTVTEAILHHEFGDQPTNIYGLVLQDADKLEVLSKERWNSAVKVYKEGKFDKEKFRGYVVTGLKWIPKLVDTFHFETSKTIARTLTSHIYQNEALMEMIDEFNLRTDFELSKREYSKFVDGGVSRK